MVKRAAKRTCPPELIEESIIYSLGQQSRVVTNIRRADVNGDRDRVVLELDGEGKDVERAIAWVTGKGVSVDSVIGGLVEG